MRQHNGVAEHTNSVLMDKARYSKLDMEVSGTFWAYAVATATHIPNLILSAVLNSKTPGESGTKSLLE